MLFTVTASIHGAEEIRDQRVPEHCAPDRPDLNVGVGDLVHHAHGERNVREVAIVRLFASLEVDATPWLAVEQTRGTATRTVARTTAHDTTTVATAMVDKNAF